MTRSSWDFRLDLGKGLPRLTCSARALSFIYSPSDTPVTASGGVIFSFLNFPLEAAWGTARLLNQLTR